MSYSPYPKYERSGVEWLGDFPEGWKVVPLKRVASFDNGAAFKPSQWSDHGTPIIRIENLNGGEDFNFFDGVVDPRYHVNCGDLLFGWSGNRGTSFGPFLWPRDGVHYLNQHIFRVSAYEADSRWLYWVLKGVTSYVETQAHGIIGMVHITKGDLGAIKVPLAPADEQVCIGAFLKEETERIDRLVAKKRRQMELLEEKRSALISHAVTRGLNPDAPLKDSGIAWLGPIPEHWKVQRLKYLTSKIEQGWSPECDRQPSADDEWGVLKAGCVNGFQFEPRENKRLPDNLEPIPSLEVRTGDFLMSRANTRDLLGSAVLLHDPPGRLLLCDKLYRFTARAEVVHDPFLFWFLRSGCGRYLFEREATGTSGSMQNISQECVRNNPVPLPPLPEQRIIAQFLTERFEQSRTLMDQLGKSVELLQEYRSALISAAVTGKMDVRDQQAA